VEPTDIDIGAAEWTDVDTLLGAYLHQDLDEVHGGPWQAVKDFAADAAPSRRASASEGLRRLVALFPDDDRLTDAARRLGMDYHPTYDGYSSYAVWLTAVADFLEDPEAHPGPPERDAPASG
jgi:hypothetical protein